MGTQADADAEVFWDGVDDEVALNRYRTLVTTIDDGLYQLDAGGRFEAVNDVIVDTTGYDRDELLGEHVSLVLSDDDIDRIEREIADQLDSEDADIAPFEIPVQTANGRTVPCELRINILVEKGEFQGTIGVARNIAEEKERKRREQELEEIESRYRTLAESFPNGAVALVDEDLHYRSVMGDPLAAGSVTAEELENQSVREAIPSRLADELVPRYRAALDGESNTFELGSNDRIFKFQTVPVRDDGGDVFSALGMSQEITDRKERERELERSERRYRTLVENFPNGVVALFDEDLRYTAVGGQLARTLDVDPEDRVGSRIPDIYPEDIVEEVQPYFHAALEGERNSFEAELHGRDLLAYTLPVRDGAGEIFAGMLMVQDITQRKERERELEQYETIVESLNEGVYVVDVDRNFRWVNESYAEMLEYSREELIGENATMVADDEVIREAEVVEEERGYEHLPRMDLELITSSGDRVPVEAASTVLPGEEEDGWFRAGVVRDITERKGYEERLEELVEELEASNERLEQFAYVASHDLREPLRMVSSYLQLLEDRYKDELDEDAEEFIGFAVDGADRMREMIEGLLQYSRVATQGDPFEPIDLDEVLADVRGDLQVRIEESDAEISAEELPRVEGDGSQLRQVFQNLLSNAIEYSGDGRPRVDISTERDGEEWHISIRDEGIGIDPSDTDRIFEVFQRLHTNEEHHGTGIGLPLCQRIVERHGGEIWVESQPGEGSTFSFTLPAVE